VGPTSDTQDATPPILVESMTRLSDQLDIKETQSEVMNEAAFLRLPDDIRRYLDREVLTLPSEEQRYRALRSWALDEFSPRLEYDPTVTASIDELSSGGRINCFSFSNLFVAAARYADVPAHFQLVDSPPQWDINDETWVLAQHINVSGIVRRGMTREEKRAFRAQQPMTGTRLRRLAPHSVDRKYVVDLNPEISTDAYRSRIISDAAAKSLFHSNRSVEALLAGDSRQAMMHARAAIAADERSATAWNNLGVLLARAGDLEDAAQAYRTALALDPDGLIGGNNLEGTYRRLGDLDKAKAVARQIRANRMRNPYFHYALGRRSYADGRLIDAVDHYQDAIDRKEDERLFYYALAQAYLELGDYQRAAENLETALEYSEPADLSRYRALSSRLSDATGEG
jgi:tetratricopeptide (TPR) repeat protein